MRRVTDAKSIGPVHAIFVGVVTLVLCPALVPSKAAAQEAPAYVIRDLAVIPRPIGQVGLLGMEPVQAELRLTEAQINEQRAILDRRLKKIQEAFRDRKDMPKFEAARDFIFRESDLATQATLTPEQRERLVQIQAQVESFVAFAPGVNGALDFARRPLPERLKLSEDQVGRCRAIVADGQKQVRTAARFPIALDTKTGPPTLETIRELVESPEFTAAKLKARQAGQDAGAAVMRRIEEILTVDQRDAYHKMLGAPFDLSKLQVGPPNNSNGDVQIVGAAFGLGGQRADPNFDNKIGRPAYVNAAKRPRVLFDEAHHNFHTAGGRYKPFADLIANDGYAVIPNREKFTREVLDKGEVLIIANALGAERMGQPEASDPAFTDAECDAVRDWVRSGGSLLFITDHAPMGAAAECLAKRFDVSLSKGATSDPSNSEGGDTSLVFTRQNQLLGDHPITRGREDSERVNRVRTFTGTSLKGPERSVAILKLADTAVDLSMSDEKPVSAAGRAQGIAFGFGHGRVVILGEAAQLSAQVIGLEGEKFGMNVPGLDNRQMALNMMHWLSGLLEPREAAIKKAG